MNFEFFVAKRLLKQEGRIFSRPIVKIATVSIALSIAVMLVSVGVLEGFKNQIREKITGFTSHIHLLPYTINYGDTAIPFTLSQNEKRNILSIENVKRLDPYTIMAGSIKTEKDFHGVLLKGVAPNFDAEFFRQHLIEGTIPDYKKNNSKQDVLISKNIADKMLLKTGDKLRVYFFIEGNYRVRPFRVAGIYQTGLGDYDEQFVICNASVIQQLNKWRKSQYSGYEVKLKDFSELQSSAKSIYHMLSQDKTVATIEDMEPNLFAWLDLLDSNVIIILILMTLVTIITACSTLLTMTFEQTQHIGILKSLGASTSSVIKIYMYKTVNITIKAMLLGNALALGIMYLQNRFKLIGLDQESYYLDSVPIEMDPCRIIAVNIASMIICSLALLIPARSISRISPIQSIKFD